MKEAFDSKEVTVTEKEKIWLLSYILDNFDDNINNVDELIKAARAIEVTFSTMTKADLYPHGGSASATNNKIEVEAFLKVAAKVFKFFEDIGYEEAGKIIKRLCGVAALTEIAGSKTETIHNLLKNRFARFYIINRYAEKFCKFPVSENNKDAIEEDKDAIEKNKKHNGPIYDTIKKIIICDSAPDRFLLKDIKFLMLAEKLTEDEEKEKVLSGDAPLAEIIAASGKLSGNMQASSSSSEESTSEESESW
jgi:hypothetical protein